MLQQSTRTSGDRLSCPAPRWCSYQQERQIQSEALKHPDSVVLFPETIVPTWSRMIGISILRLSMTRRFRVHSVTMDNPMDKKISG